jgi:type II secretory pathway pseudopilin PulG
MITSTPFTERRRRAAYTLVELMVAATLAVVVLAGILSSFLLLGRSTYNTSAYNATAAEIRGALETFAADVRQASGIHWVSDQCVTLYVPAAANATQAVTYGFDADRASRTYRCFYRQIGTPGSSAPRQALVHDVAADFAFHRYKLDQPGVADHTAANDLETKQLQLDLRAVHTGITTVATSETAISACYVLRNKRVSE